MMNTIPATHALTPPPARPGGDSFKLWLRIGLALAVLCAAGLLGVLDGLAQQQNAGATAESDAAPQSGSDEAPGPQAY